MPDVHFDLRYRLPVPYAVGGTPALGTVTITNHSDEPVVVTFVIGPFDESSPFYAFRPSCPGFICDFKPGLPLCITVASEVAPGATEECNFQLSRKLFMPDLVTVFPPGNYDLMATMAARGVNSQSITSQVIERSVSIGNSVVNLPMLNTLGVAALFVLIALVGLKAIKARIFKAVT